jgi:hypothetical protein
MNISDFEKKILGDTEKLTKEERENISEILLTSTMFEGRGVPLVDIIKAVKESWDKVLAKKEKNSFSIISYWEARTRALTYLLTRKEFVRPSDDESVSYPELYKNLPQHVMDFLKSIDRDSTILVISDRDKGNFLHWKTFLALQEFLLMETHHMRIRVGGNSYRLADSFSRYLLGFKGEDRRRFEFFFTPFEEPPYCSERTFEKICEATTVRSMKKYEYDLASDFVWYVDQYDIRKSRFGWNEKMKVVTDYIVDEPIVGANSVVIPSASKDIVPEILKDGSFVKKADPALHLHGSLAVHWIKNELSGFIHDGEFCVFNNPQKGAQAIADVMMVKGYQDVAPATHVLYSDTTSNLAENEQQLFKDAGLISHHLFQPYNIND